MFASALVLFGIVSFSAALPECVIDEHTSIPDVRHSDDPAWYKMFEAGLQIFTHFRIPCDGVLTEWHYMTPHSVFPKVHFGIFRMRPDSTLADPVFDLVNQTFIRTEPKDWTPKSWAIATVQPIPVLAGDYIGLFYDALETASDDVMIPSNADENLVNAETLVYLMDGAMLMASDRVVHAKFEIRQRAPAMFAIVTRLPPPIIPQPIIIEETTTTTTPAITTLPPKRCFLPSPQEPQYSTSSCLWPIWRAYFDNARGTCVDYFGCAPTDSAPANNYDSVQLCRLECPDIFKPMPAKLPVEPPPVVEQFRTVPQPMVAPNAFWQPFSWNPMMGSNGGGAPTPATPNNNNWNNWPTWNGFQLPNINTGNNNNNNWNGLGNIFGGGNNVFPFQWM